MKRKTIKILSVGLCLCMLLSLLCACSDKDDKKGENNNGNDTTVQTSGAEGFTFETDEKGYVKDTINQTFNGKEVKVLTWKQKRSFLFPEKGTSGKDGVVDSVYSRNLALSERLDVFFDVYAIPGEYGDRTEFLQAAERAGDEHYDLICTYSLWPSQLAIKGYLRNLLQYAYPQLEMPWWPDSISEWSQYDALFFIANNSSIPVIKSMEVCYANLDLIEEAHLESPLDLVLKNEWTLEKMITYATTFGNSFDPDDPNHIYGIVVDEQSRLDAFFYGCGFNITRNNASGKAELYIDTQDSRDAVTAFVKSMGRMFSNQWSDVLKDSVAPMKNNATVFQVASMSRIESANNKSYAPLPMPRLNENQQNYRTISNNSFDVWCIPTSASAPEMSAVIIEAFASSDYRDLAPDYFDRHLKMLYSNSQEGVEVFDIIRGSVIYDFGRISVASIGVAEQPFRNCFAKSGVTIYSDNYISNLDNKVEGYKQNLETILASYRKYKNQ